MSSLKIYVQDFVCDAEGQILNLEKYLSESNFHIGCITNSTSYLFEMSSAEEGVDTDKFDIFGKQVQNVGQSYAVIGPSIAVRKHLSAHLRTEWMTETEKCVWVTVPSRGCRSRLHVACVDLAWIPQFDFFTETLTSLSKTHANDKFLVVARVPLYWYSGETQPIRTLRSKINDSVNGFCSSLSDAGLAQFNKITDKHSYVLKAVFSSIPVTVTHCQRPFVPEEQFWRLALEFSLNIGQPECCKTATDATGEDCTNEPSGQREARQEGVNASGDSSTIIDRLVHTKWDEITKLISEKLEQTVIQLKAENESGKSAYESLRARIEMIEEHLKTSEERALAHRERSRFASTGTQTKFSNPAGREVLEAASGFGSTPARHTPPLTEHCSAPGAFPFGASLSQQYFSFGDSNTCGLFNQLSTSRQTKFGDKPVGGFAAAGTTSASPFTRTLDEPAGSRAFGTRAAWSTQRLPGTSAVPEVRLFGASSSQAVVNFGQSNTGPLFGNDAHAGSKFFGQPSTSEQNAFGTKPAGFRDQQAIGTVVKYAPQRNTELIVKDGQSQLITVHYTCITFMKEYENKSLEELRMEDYAANRTGSGQLQQRT